MWKTYIRETGWNKRTVLGESSGQRKEEKEIWRWNLEVQEPIQRKRFVKKKWDSERTKESRQECKEVQCRAKREAAKGKLKLT